METTTRPYEPADREACLALFDGNTPRFFDASERAEYDAFLRALETPYSVIEQGGRIVACGGHAVEADGTTAVLCWGMVDRGLQGTSLGRRLTQARLAAARATPGVTAVRLSTSQHTEGFYRRFGFRTLKVAQDGFAPGIHSHEMRLDL
ncbi:MAG: GNAT family N-acetyltransferase [Brevundimonas sp.]|uniref:GNAT family N-acetyltransferase n=1 Tax=Brevundimonas sp. TaxID=1871086 RepID=UPI0025C61818|nr:GNAT family N-acetyltransferase [Brevundimonas sp.]MBX3477084.1 GNAT family N-acetyltransferase [Brevundimonas sp.]